MADKDTDSVSQEQGANEAGTGQALHSSEGLVHIARALGAALNRLQNSATWIEVDINRLTISSKSVYMEVTGYCDESGQRANAKAVIWSANVNPILRKFKTESGCDLAPGMRVWIRSQLGYHSEYGLRLNIIDIKPALSESVISKRRSQIRELLMNAGLEHGNKFAPAPQFRNTLVIAPTGAAALDDFKVEADRLEKNWHCRFYYRFAPFQGKTAASEITDTLRSEITLCDDGSCDYDAVVIIRGGGSASDLAWLDDHELAKFICNCSLPVITGIGHENDSTILDEVAYYSFGTPSKVIAAIEIALRLGEFPFWPSCETTEEALSR